MASPEALRLRISAAVQGHDPGAPTERIVEVTPVDGCVRIGRRPRLELTLPFRALSSLHARLVRVGEGYHLEDLGSANGTFLDGRRLLPRAPQPIRPGDSFQVADVTLAWERRTTEADGEQPSAGALDLPASTATLARRMVAGLFAAARPPGSTRLVEVAGDPRRELVVPRGRVMSVGRAATCDLVLNDDGVSREHAAFQRLVDGLFMRDLDSKNGSTVNQRVIEGRILLRDGDEVAIGSVRFRVEDPEDRSNSVHSAAARPPPGGAPPTAPRPRTGHGRLARSPAVVAPVVVGGLVLLAVAGTTVYLFLAG